MSKYGAYDFPSHSFLCEFIDGHYVEKLFDSWKEAEEYFAEDLSDTCIVAAHVGEEAKVFDNEPEEVYELPKKNVKISLFEE